MRLRKNLQSSRRRFPTKMPPACPAGVSCWPSKSMALPSPDYSSAHTNPKRKRGREPDLPRLRFGLVYDRPGMQITELMNNPG